jgi:PhzF family phenazine biosynthesis protein
MTELRLFQVDAFADRPFTGNPAAVVPLEREWLPDEVMQSIAMENNLSETAFTVPVRQNGPAPATGDADYELRWFTPTTEIVFCGHATLASGHVLIEGDEVRFRTRKSGVMTVGRGEAGALTLDVPLIPMRAASHPELVRALGTPGAQTFLSQKGSQETAIALLEDEEGVLACRPDMNALREVRLMAIVTAPGRGNHDVVSRVFVPAWGVDEDPVTGSAHAALTPFWTERLGRDSFTAYQASRRGGTVHCRIAGERAILGGRCVTVIEGKFRI